MRGLAGLDLLTMAKVSIVSVRRINGRTGMINCAEIREEGGDMVLDLFLISNLGSRIIYNCIDFISPFIKV